MKLFICTLLVIAIHGLNCAPVDDEDDVRERKYGLGFDIGGSYKGNVKLGVNSDKDSGHFIFLDKTASGKANADLGFYKSEKLATPPPPPNNPFFNQYDPRYPVSPNYLYPTQYDPRFAPPMFSPYQFGQQDPRFTMPAYNPYSAQYGPRYPLPVYNSATQRVDAVLPTQEPTNKNLDYL